MSLKFGRIQPWTAELAALDHFINLLLENCSEYFDDLLSGERSFGLLVYTPAKHSFVGGGIYCFQSVDPTILLSFSPHFEVLLCSFSSSCPILFKFSPHLNNQKMHVFFMKIGAEGFLPDPSVKKKLRSYCTQLFYSLCTKT